MATSNSDQAIAKLLGQYGSAPVSQEHVALVQKHIQDQPWGADVLAFIEKHTQILDGLQLQPLVFSPFKKNRAAIGGFLSAGIGGYVNVGVPSLGKDFNGGFAGILIASPINGAAGSLYYDDESQISGRYAIQIGSVGPWFAINFFQDNQVKMTYQAAAVPSIGIAGGGGGWN